MTDAQRAGGKLSLPRLSMKIEVWKIQNGPQEGILHSDLVSLRNSLPQDVVMATAWTA